MSKTSSTRGGLNRRSMLAGTASLLASPMIGSPAWAQAKPINIGVIMPLSGANAQFGINSRNGIELVADEINAAGGIKALGGAKINLVVADATSTPTTAGTVAQRLHHQNDVSAILGAFASSLTIAILGSHRAPRHSAAHHVLCRPDHRARLQEHLPDRRQGFGARQGAADYTLAIAQASGAKIDKIAIMYEDTAYGTAQAGGLRAAAKPPTSKSRWTMPIPWGLQTPRR